MGKVEVRIKLAIQFYNNFFIGGGMGAGYIHSYLLRDIDGFPYIPGSALKGCISQSAYALQPYFPDIEEKDVKRLFGNEGTNYGMLYFDHGKLVNREQMQSILPQMIELKTGIQMNVYTQTKKERNLYTKETTGQAGAMEYISQITGFFSSETVEREIAFLTCAIRFVIGLGQGRSAGMGWLKKPIQCTVCLNPEQKTCKEDQICT